MKEELEKFQRLLRQISERPAMYAGRYDIELVAAYLDGYTFGVGGVILDLWGDFKCWIEAYYQVCDSGWSWHHILLYGNGSHRAALAAIPRHFGELLEHGPLPQPSYDWVSDRVRETRGQGIFAPQGEHPHDKVYPLFD